MMYLISTFFFWLMFAVALGALVSWITCGRGEGSFFGGVVPWVLMLGLGGLVSLAQLLPQRPGFWFDLGVMMLAAYFAGCCVGCLLGRLFGKSLGEPVRSGALADATSRPVTRVMIREKERAVDPQLKPLAAAEAAPEEAVVGLSGPRGGVADDLTKIYGIDAETQGKLNGLGIYHYDQLAGFSPGNRRWVFRNLGHEGRFPSWWWRWRYDAEKLMSGGSTSVAAADLGAGSIEAPVAKGRKSGSKVKVAAKAPAESQASAPLASADAAAPDAAVEDSGAGAVASETAAATLAANASGGERPPTLGSPRGGKADDLKRIRGIGKQNEGRLHGLGIWHFDQIAAWDVAQSHWVGAYLAFPGRIEREDWVAQAKVLATGDETEFSKRADAGKVATSRSDVSSGETNIAVLGKDFPDKNPGDKA